MKDSLLNVDWGKSETFSDEDISYYLYLEGKSAEAISRIRGTDRETVRSHIINGKIKYGMIASCSGVDELFRKIANSPKADKVGALSCLGQELQAALVDYIVRNYSLMRSREKETAVWILGETKLREGYGTLRKALVHNHINIRRMAVSAMGKICDIYFETALIKALEDENPQVVCYAIKALDRLESLAAYDRIKEIFENADKDYLKYAAENYLQGRTL
ncbi:MAG: lyase [Firmicutes bacterium]|nr:lyase [Bacillota bacterium]